MLSVTLNTLKDDQLIILKVKNAFKKIQHPFMKRTMEQYDS